MFFNFRYPVILFILSFAGILIGMVLKIFHLSGGQLIIGSMLMVQAFSIIWLVVILIKGPKGE